eukprot:g14056.t1
MKNENEPFPEKYDLCPSAPVSLKAAVKLDMDFFQKKSLTANLAAGGRALEHAQKYFRADAADAVAGTTGDVSARSGTTSGTAASGPPPASNYLRTPRGLVDFVSEKTGYTPRHTTSTSVDSRVAPPGSVAASAKVKMKRAVKKALVRGSSSASNGGTTTTTGAPSAGTRNTSKRGMLSSSGTRNIGKLGRAALGPAEDDDDDARSGVSARSGKHAAPDDDGTTAGAPGTIHRTSLKNNYTPAVEPLFALVPRPGTVLDIVTPRDPALVQSARGRAPTQPLHLSAPQKGSASPGQRQGQQQPAGLWIKPMSAQDALRNALVKPGDPSFARNRLVAQPPVMVGGGTGTGTGSGRISMDAWREHSRKIMPTKKKLEQRSTLASRLKEREKLLLQERDGLSVCSQTGEQKGDSTDAKSDGGWSTGATEQDELRLVDWRYPRIPCRTGVPEEWAAAKGKQFRQDVATRAVQIQNAMSPHQVCAVVAPLIEMQARGRLGEGNVGAGGASSPATKAGGRIRQGTNNSIALAVGGGPDHEREYERADVVEQLLPFQCAQTGQTEQPTPRAIRPGGEEDVVAPAGVKKMNIVPKKRPVKTKAAVTSAAVPKAKTNASKNLKSVRPRAAKTSGPSTSSSSRGTSAATPRQRTPPRLIKQRVASSTPPRRPRPAASALEHEQASVVE